MSASVCRHAKPWACTRSTDTARLWLTHHCEAYDVGVKSFGLQVLAFAILPTLGALLELPLSFVFSLLKTRPRALLVAGVLIAASGYCLAVILLAKCLQYCDEQLGWRLILAVVVACIWSDYKRITGPPDRGVSLRLEQSIGTVAGLVVAGFWLI